MKFIFWTVTDFEFVNQMNKSHFSFFSFGFSSVSRDSLFKHLPRNRDGMITIVRLMMVYWSYVKPTASRTSEPK